MRLPPHATAVVVAVVDGATTARSSPLLHHHRPRPRHTASCWRSPRPLPPTGRLTSRWSPRTPTSLQGVIREAMCHPRLGLPQPGYIGPRALVIDPSGGGGGEEDIERRITVVTSPVGAPMVHQMARISVGPWGRPQGPLVPRTETMPSTLAAPPSSSSVLPSPDASPSGFGTPPDLLSPCGNQMLRWFTHFTTLSIKGRTPGSWDSTVGPSR
jgi:hypothetical protein